MGSHHERPALWATTTCADHPLREEEMGLKTLVLSVFKRLSITAAGLVFFLTLAGSAGGELMFMLDFYRVDVAPDGIYEDAWPLRGGEVMVDVYVSNVPEPGLTSMGFFIEFDPEILGIVKPGEETKVDRDNWPLGPVPDTSVGGQLGVVGGREFLQTGLAGDNIRLATIRFKSQGIGVSDVQLRGCVEPQNCFVLDDATVLDGDIPPEGIVLARIHPGFPGDVNGDGAVELTDAILALKAVLGMSDPFVCYTADINGDGKIGLAEAGYVLQEVASLRESSP